MEKCANENGNPQMALPLVVAEWPRNQREVIRVKLDTYQGRNTIDVRSWYPSVDGEFRPGKGFTVSVAHLPALAGGLAKALRTAEGMGLVSCGDA